MPHLQFEINKKYHTNQKEEFVKEIRATFSEKLWIQEQIILQLLLESMISIV